MENSTEVPAPPQKKNKLQIELIYDPSILLGIYLKKTIIQK